ncbi:hypothetical protein OFB80_30420, partial [Escherichia coli]|nr:hypothetical protein [Escherichia coli]
KDESEVLSDGGFPDDAEASIRETPETAAMAVRRGGRGRRRGGRGKKKQASDSTDVSSDTSFAEEDKLHGQDSSDLISDTADGFIAEDE